MNSNRQAANPAQITDPNLVNAWGISMSSGSPFWVSDNGTGVATLYNVNPNTNATTINSLVVTIPPVGTGTPTGQVFNTNSAGGASNGDLFLFVSEDGTISGWRASLGTTAEVLQLASFDNVYKGPRKPRSVDTATFTPRTSVPAQLTCSRGTRPRST